MSPSKIQTSSSIPTKHFSFFFLANPTGDFIRMLGEYNDFVSAVDGCTGAFTVCKSDTNPSQSLTVGILPSSVGVATSFLPKGVPSVLTPDGRVLDLVSASSLFASLADSSTRCLVLIVTDWDSTFGGVILSFEHLVSVKMPISVRRPSPPASGRAVSPAPGPVWSLHLNHIFSGISPLTCSVTTRERGFTEVRLRSSLQALGETWGLEHLFTFSLCVSTAEALVEHRKFHQFVGRYLSSCHYVQRQACERDRREIEALKEALSSNKLREVAPPPLGNEEGPPRSRGARVDTAENGQGHADGPFVAARPRATPAPRGRGRGVRIGT